MIGFFGTLTAAGGRYSAPEGARLFVMVGICGGFTTFSAFSLQTFDLLRSGEVARATANVAASVLLCLAATAAGHWAAIPLGGQTAAVAETAVEEASS